MSDTEKITNALGFKELVPQIYKDLLQPGIQKIGTGGMLQVAKTVNVLLSPLNLVVWGADQMTDWLKISVAAKLAKNDIKDIKPPPINIAGPALQGLTFSFDINEIRELYKNLIANSMVIDNEKIIHPSFNHIIQQLSPDEARVLNELQEFSAWDILEQYDLSSYYNKPQKDSITIFSDIVKGINEDQFEIIKDNLNRLRLISVRETFNAELEQHRYYVENPEGYYLNKSEYEEITLTEYGKIFIECCCL